MGGGASRAQSGTAGGAPEDFFGQQDDPDFFDKLPDEVGWNPTFGLAFDHTSAEKGQSVQQDDLDL